MASVRFICGTQDQHKALGRSCPPSSAPKTASSTPPASTPTAVCSRPFSVPRRHHLRRPQPCLHHRWGAVVQDRRYRYANNDMAELEAQLKQADADGARFKLIATDGVFSMDGVIADLKSICDLADKLRCAGDGG